MDAQQLLIIIAMLIAVVCAATRQIWLIVMAFLILCFGLLMHGVKF